MAKIPRKIKADITCECGEKYSFVWVNEDNPDDEDGVCSKCDSILFRPPTQVPKNNNVWKRFKDEEPKNRQHVWLHTKTIFAPNVEYNTYSGKEWYYPEGKDQVSPEDYWMPFSYPAKPT